MSFDVWFSTRVGMINRMSLSDTAGIVSCEQFDPRQHSTLSSIAWFILKYPQRNSFWFLSNGSVADMAFIRKWVDWQCPAMPTAIFPITAAEEQSKIAPQDCHKVWRADCNIAEYCCCWIFPFHIPIQILQDEKKNSTDSVVPNSHG